MPFVEVPPALKDKLQLGRVSPPVLIGVVSAVLVVLALTGFAVLQVFDAEAFSLSKQDVSQTDVDGDASSQAGAQTKQDSQDPNDSDGAAGSDGDGSATSRDANAQSESKVVVYVCGCVNAPGVYEFAEGSRLMDAVERAGGFTDSAAKEALNLAKPLQDGEQVRIPSVEEHQASIDSGAGVSSTAGATSSSESGGLVNLNSATEAELIDLPGIGEATAAKIIASREEEGPFQTIEDLKRVSGIGDKKFEALKDLICV